MTPLPQELQTYGPGPVSKAYIQWYWTLDRAGENAGIHCQLPLDGGVNLIFNLSGPVDCRVDGAPSVTLAGDFMVGSFARYLELRSKEGLSLFGVRFAPEGLYPFFSMPMVDVSNFCIEMEEVWELYGFGLSDLIRRAGPGPNGRIGAFEVFFDGRMADFREHSLNVERAVALIRSHRGQIPVDTLAGRVKVSRRHLERKFAERIGVPPKQLCRIFRIKHVLARMGGCEWDGASLAAAAGYFDQAHFIRDFRFFTGQRPSARMI